MEVPSEAGKTTALDGEGRVLARALWNDRGERPRAGQLAEQARDAFSEAGEAAKDDLAEVEAWLGEHRGPSVAAREAP